MHSDFTYCGAALYVESPDWIPVIHSIERRHLVYPHWRHLEYPRHLVHDTDARKAMLPLSQVQQGHDRRLLVLAWVPAEHFLNEVLIGLVEFEGD